MRYEDASHTGAFQGSEPIANDDFDALPAGSKTPATGNLITGEGTQSGSAGADQAVGAHITAIAGQGGEDTSFAGGKLSVSGEFGNLSVDAEGNYSYVAKGGVENVRDRFTYTLADNQGNSDTAALIVEIGKTPVVIKADAQQIVPGPDGVVTLPPGVELSDIRVVGRNLVIDMPDGTQLIIIDGAVFVPQLVLGGVEIPATNVAALLIGQEPQPAAGETPPLSGGGNFALPPPPLDPGVPLGDLIPPTEYGYTPPEPQEVLDTVDEEPEIFIQPDGQPASVNAVDSVDEAGLPERNEGEPEGSGEEAAAGDNGDTSETTTGTIIYDSPDEPSVVTINGVAVTSVGQTFDGLYGTLTITSIADGAIGYSYTLADNTSGDDTSDFFEVSVTDVDGDVATATLTIDIIDDVPTARPDTDTVAAGEYGPVTGNVITDASAGDVGDSDSGADTVGADDAALTAVTGAGSTEEVEGGWVVQGQYGVLEIAADGSYSYTRNPGTPGGVQDVFNYTLTDGDGDPSSTTLTITIEDLEPETGENPTALLDDDALPNGIPGGVGDNVDAANLTGFLAASGGDGPLTYDLLLTGAPAGFSYVDGPDGAVHVMQGDTHVLTITIDAGTGAYEVSQVNPIDHPAGGDENNVEFTINYRVTDQDGDFADGTLDINVDDDSPEMNRAEVSVPTLLVDETDLATNDSADYSVIFDGAYGADGPGTTSYAVSVVNGTDSGLVDVATGDPILLFMNGDVVEGRVGGEGGAVAFTVSVDSGTGVVTLDQIRALDHPDTSDHDDPVSAIADSVHLTASITDADSDSDSLTVNIGHTLVFEDDGPSISPTQEEPSLTVDETVLGTDDTADFSGSFTADFGADGPADSNAISYALGINAGATGLVDTLSGEAVVLVLNGGVVEGRTAVSDELVFTVSVDADGNVELDQLRAVVHDDPNDPDESSSPAQLAADNLITLTATATDGDGDTDSATINIGQNLNFEDDGPSVEASGEQPILTVDESDLGTDDSANFAGVFTADFGNDGPASSNATTYALSITAGASGLVDTLSGEAVILVLNGGVVEGRTETSDELVFTISVDGSGNVELDQLRAVVHDDPTDHDESTSPAQLSADNLVQLTATVTDGDGDQDSATVHIGLNLNFEDDGPSISPTQEEPSLTVDETDLGIDDTADFSGSFTADFGADGPADSNAISYALGINAGATGLVDTLSGEDVVLVLNGGVVEGRTESSNLLVFTVSVNGSGVVELDQLRAVVHDDPNDPDENSSPAQLASDNLITLTATATDGDGDTDSATINIGQNLNFEDDGPDAQVDGDAELDTLVLDETTPPGTETDGDSDPAGLVSVTADFSDNFVAPIDYGADGPGDVSYSLVLDGSDVPSGLYAVDPGDTDDGDGDGYGQGDEIVLNQSGNTVTGSVGGVEYFTIAIDPVTGVVTFTQLDNIWHADAGDDDDTSTLMAEIGALLVRQTVTDGDGDSDMADVDISQGVFQIEDDGPVANNDVDEIASGGSSASGNVITGAGTNAGIANADDVGADQPGTITAISGFGGTDDEFNGGVLEIAGQYGTLEIDADGNYTYTRNDGSPGNVQDVFTYTLTDADGDSTTATLTINVEDAAPNLPDPDLVQLDDDALTDGNPGTPAVGDDVDSAGLPGQLMGTGGDGDLDYNFTGVDTLPAGFTTNLVNAGTLQVLQGATVVLTITLDNETGAFNVVQNNPIDHLTLEGTGEDDTENNYEFSIGVEVVDADNDVEPATITINVDDDTPVIQNVTAGAGVDVDETDAGSPAGFPISDTSADPVINADLLFGADGPAAANSVVYGLAIVGGSPEPSGLATAQGDFPITLVQVDSDTIEGRYEDGGTQVAFTVQMNADGTVTLTQEVPLEHLVDGGTPADYNDTLDLDGLIEATVTITDHDGDETSDSVEIGGNLVFYDDGPDAAVDAQVDVPTLTLDETRPEGEDEGGPNVTTGLASVTVGFAGNFLAADYGADGAGTTSYALVLAAEGSGSGLYALDNTDTDDGDGDGYGQGDEILLFTEGDGSITGRTTDGGPVYFTISVDGSGQVTFEQSLNVWHADTVDDDDTSSLSAAAETLQLEQTVTDSDGDFDTALIDLSDGVFAIEDDGPEIIAVTNELDIINNADPNGMGNFDFDIGTDAPNGGNDDIFVDNFQVSVNGVALDPADFELVEGSEDATTASYTFSFTYDTGDGGTTTANGTLVFDKVNGTYTVDLDGPIQGFTVASVQQGADPIFHDIDLNDDGDTSDPGEADNGVAVVEIAENFFIQFTGQEEVTTPASDFGHNDEWGGGSQSEVKISSTAIGVFGNSVQDGDVLDYNFYSSNPGADFTQPPTTSAGTAFIQITQFNGAEDFVITLKLADPDTPGTYITRTIVVNPDDVITTDVAGYPTLGPTDGLIIIEPNDYINLPGVPDDYEIVGMQLRSSTEGVQSTNDDPLTVGVNEGEVYNFDGDLGAFDNSTAEFGPLGGGDQGTNDNDVFKILDIGAVIESTENQTATLNFDVTITDADGDSQTESITVNINGTDTVALTAMSTMESSSEPSNDNSSLLVDTSDSPGKSNHHQFSQSVGNTGIVAGIVAASGLAAMPAAAHDLSSFGDAELMATTSSLALSNQVVEQFSVDSFELGGLSAELGGPSFDIAGLAPASRGFDEFVSSNHGLDASAFGQATPAYEPSFAIDQAPTIDAAAFNAIAPTVGMPSAEALIAAGLTGGGQHGGSVEQILADALGQGAAPTVDALLDALQGGEVGGAPAIEALASHVFDNVPAWDMSMQAAFGQTADMMFKMDVVTLHHDAVQPVVNG